MYSFCWSLLCQVVQQPASSSSQQQQESEQPVVQDRYFNLFHLWSLCVNDFMFGLTPVFLFFVALSGDSELWAFLYRLWFRDREEVFHQHEWYNWWGGLQVQEDLDGDVQWGQFWNEKVSPCFYLWIYVVVIMFGDWMFFFSLTLVFVGLTLYQETLDQEAEQEQVQLRQLTDYEDMIKTIKNPIQIMIAFSKTKQKPWGTIWTLSEFHRWRHPEVVASHQVPEEG